MVRYSGKLYFLIFFITGMAGLMAESIWQQYLAIVGGGETQAAAIVLAVIMGGSALGAHIAGARMKGRPFRTFALIEIAIGIWCLLFPVFFPLGQEAFSLMTAVLGSDGFALMLARMVVAFLLLAAPAILSGATFPLMAAGVSQENGKLKRVSVPARLYACNAGGGATGAVLAGFVFIPALGLHGSIVLAGMLDILAGLFIFILAHRSPPLVSGQDQRLDQDKGPDRRVPTSAHNPIRNERPIHSLSFLAVTGAVIFALEIIYFRLLSPLLDSSGQSFTLMLAVFIGGLAVGGAISARLVRGIEKTAVLIWQQLMLAMAIIGSLLIADQLPWVLLQLRDGIAADDAGYFSWMLIRMLVSALVMLPVAVLAGISFPLLLSLVTRNDVSVRNVSMGWKWNVGGTIIGALAASLFLVPVMGVRAGLVILGVLTFGTGLYAVIRTGIRRRTVKAKAGMVLISVVFLVMAGSAFLRSNHENLFGLAWTLDKNPFETRQEYLRALAGHTVLFFKEDDELSVSVTSHKDLRKLSGFSSFEKNDGALETRTLRVNGKPDASDNINDMSTQLLLAHIPLLLHSSPTQVAVVGLGSGTTTGAVLAHHEVASVDTIEISRAVVLASRYFSSVNRSYFNDPRSRIFVRDAGIHFSAADKKYDVIISEPSHPWMAGVSRLFTGDFFYRCRESLADNGVMAQWVHVAGLSDRTLARIFATFEAVFHGSSIWMCNNGDLLMLGWRGRKRLPADLDTRMQRVEIQTQLKSLGIQGREDFLLREMTTIGNVLRKCPQAPFSSMHPELAAIAPLEMFTRKQATVHCTNDQRLRNSGSLLADSLPGVRERKEDVMKPFLKYLMVHERNFSLVLGIVEALPYRLRDSAVWAALAVYQADEKNMDKAERIWDDILKTDQDYVWKLEHADFLLSRTDPRIQAQRSRLKNALSLLDDDQQKGEVAARAAWVRGQGLARLGEYALAEKSAYKALSFMQPNEQKGVNAAHVYTLLAGIQIALAQEGTDTLGKNARLDMARSMIQQAEVLDPENLTGARQLRVKLNRMPR